MIELRKKARSLEIQAEKAEKAKKYKDELETLDKALTLHDLNKIEEELIPLSERIKTRRKRRKRLRLPPKSWKPRTKRHEVS